MRLGGGKQTATALVKARTQQLVLAAQCSFINHEAVNTPTESRCESPTLHSSQPKSIQLFCEGPYAYYGVAGNFRSLQKVHRALERYWHKMLCSRTRAARMTWDVFHQIKQRQPILRPKLRLPYRELQAIAGL